MGFNIHEKLPIPRLEWHRKEIINSKRNGEFV